MISIIDYGCGNIKAIINVYHSLNVPVLVAQKKEHIKESSKLILPGVGAFDHVIKSFNSSGFREIVEKKVLEDKTPILGICSGMQIMADASEEGKELGLGWIPGNVLLFNKDQIPFETKYPHMGWNKVTSLNETLFKNIDDGSRFYFVHSYYFSENNSDHAIAKTSYGMTFTSALSNNNIYGVQFHPEKSHDNGIKLLSNFSNL